MSPLMTLMAVALVERHAPEPPSWSRDPRVIRDLEQPVGLVAMVQRLLQRVGVIDHRAELQELERAAVPSDPRLPKNTGPREQSLIRPRWQA